MRPTNLFNTVALLLSITFGYGQVNDSFTDGDFSSAPEWLGDTVKFDVVAGELWLNAAPVIDDAYLSTPNLAMVNAEWQFYNRMEFNPSSANFCRFYLISDQRNLSYPTNGYYVELGRINDEISLYKLVNGTPTKIIDGPDNMLNSAICSTRVQATRTGNLWELLVDTTGSNSFISLGSFLDASIQSTYFMGPYCKYTSTRSDKFFFDEILSTGTPWMDITAPSIIMHQVETNILSLTLNEPVRSTNLSQLNFTLDNGLSVLQVAEDSLDCRKLHITASGNFLNNIMYHLGIDSLQDFSGNHQTNINYPFLIHPALPGEIVFNEIMADPSPPVNLPNAEFIELKNNSSYPINLFNWTIKIGGTSKLIPAASIDPGGFIILLDENDTSLFNASIPKIGIATFPGITNGGVEISIFDSSDTQMDSLAFNLSWYHDPAKDDGGYSLERINPNEFCLTANNWTASTHVNGGTPGSENAVYNPLFVDINANTTWVDSVHLLVVFNQQMDPTSLLLGNFNLQNLTSIQVLSNDSCILVLSNPLPVNTSYNLSLFTSLRDCNNNTLPTTLDIPVVNYSPEIFDLLIHELMIDESPAILLPEAEYIELMNTRPFPIQLLGYQLKVNGTTYTLSNYTIKPDSFIVLVNENNVALFANLPVAAVDGFAGLTNESGLVELFHVNGTLLHAAKYDLSFYDADGKDDGGWSLEMVDDTKPCLKNLNWSASQDVTGGTPGRKNSFQLLVNDVHRPHAIKTGLLGLDTVLIYFDEGILPGDFNQSDIEFSNGMNAMSVQYQSSLLDVYQIILPFTISSDTTYFVRLNQINDCAGNILLADSLPFSVPSFPENFDLVINEILADPTSNCIDYVEIYNRSNKTIDLTTLIIGEGDTSNFYLSSFVPMHNQSVLLHPSEYIFISEDHEKVISCYAMQDTTAYWDVASLPDFASASGIVGVSAFTQQSIDMFAYNDGMHLSTLNSTDGVSLERLDIHSATQNSMNWHSAASTVGFGTPGYQNSQFSPDILISDDFAVDPEVFSPDNDGYKDYVKIYYQLDQPGFIAHLKIYDQAGRLEKQLVNGELLGTSGSFVWDGTDEEGAKVKVGIHIIYFEIIGTNGELLQFKKPVVVGAKL